MENAVEALKTAAAVLVFIIAITTSFTMFSKAKVTADTITKTQDSQKYLESAELYTSSDKIKSQSDTDSIETRMTKEGDRIVGIDDVISTIYRYYLESYAVTIIKDKTVIARFDSNTEDFIRKWYNISDGKDSDGKTISANDIKNKFVENIKKNISVPRYEINSNNVNLDLENLYKVETDENDKRKVGAPWYGNSTEIIKRINEDISPDNDNDHHYYYNLEKYIGKGLKELLKDKTIVEVVNEIDNSEYIDANKTLLKSYQLPTIEVIYIVY